MDESGAPAPALPLLARARELHARDPVVAYYCRYYAAQISINHAASSKDSQAFLRRLLDSLEQEKKDIAGNEAITNDVVGYAHIENFALRIFVNADNEDRAGMASKKTAKTFLAASIFLELLKVFGDLDPEVQQKIKYAKFKAADIMKALKEGRVPTPGPPGGEPAEDDAADLAQDAAGDAPAPAHTQDPTQPQQQQPQLPSVPHGFEQPPITGAPAAPSPHMQYPGVAPGVAPVAAHIHPAHHLPPASSLPAADTGPDLSAVFDEQAHKAITQAQKHAKFAISALQYEDLPTAMDNLAKAMGLLQALAAQRQQQHHS